MNRTTITRALTIAGLTAAAAVSTLIGAGTAHADSQPTVTARHGIIYLHTGHDDVRLTADEVNTQPRVNHEGTRITYVHNATIWVMNTDGTDQHQISDRVGNTPRWTTDGQVTYTADACTYRTSTDGGSADEAIAPAACVGQQSPQMGYITEQPLGPEGQ